MTAVAQTDWHAMPPFLQGSQPNMDAGAAVGLAGGLAGVGRAMSGAVDVQNHTVESMVIALSRQIGEAEQATRRHRSWWGRFFNRNSGAVPFYAKMSGHHLMQLQTMSGRNFGAKSLDRRAPAMLRLDLAKEACGSLMQRMEASDVQR